MAHKTVTMLFPKRVNLNVGSASLGGAKIITFEKGPNEVPVEHKDHWYLKANGVTVYEPPKSDPEPDPEPDAA